MSFTSSGLTFMSSIHLELIFEYGVSDFILLHIAARFSLHHLLESLSSPPLHSLASCVKIKVPYMHGLISGLYILLHWATFLFSCH